MSTVIGNYNVLNNSFRAGYTYNQHARVIPIPSAGTITRVGGWYNATQDGDYLDSLTHCRMVVWDNSTGAVLAQSSEFTIPQTGSKARYEMDVPALAVAAGNVKAGIWHKPQKVYDGSLDLYIMIGCQTPSGSGTFYDKVASTSGPSSMAGEGTDPYLMNAYVYFTASPVGKTVKVRRGGTWVSAPVKVRRGGAWVDPTSVKVRRGGAWVDVS